MNSPHPLIGTHDSHGNPCSLPRDDASTEPIQSHGRAGQQCKTSHREARRYQMGEGGSRNSGGMRDRRRGAIEGKHRNT